MKKIILEATDEMFPWITGFIATMEHATKVQVKVTIKDMDQVTAETVGDRSTVKYHALAGLDVLQELGDRTIIGLVFTKLVEDGPMTVKEVHAKYKFKPKTIEGCMNSLRHMGFVESREIDV